MVGVADDDFLTPKSINLHVIPKLSLSRVIRSQTEPNAAKHTIFGTEV